MNKRLLKVMAAAAVVIVGLWVYASFDPTVDRFFPRCIFKELTGWDCSGCGSQRSIHAMLTGHFGDVWHYNAMFYPTMIVLLLLVVTRMYPERMNRLRRFLGSRGFIMTVFVVIVAWTIIRNIIKI